jgi:uncharacterized protein
MYRHLLLLITLFSLCVAPVAYGGMEEANSEELKVLAEKGNPNAQYTLGEMYRSGQGAPQSYAEAVKWFRKAADQGDARAQLSLGFSYKHGEGVRQDYSEAVRWFRKAADQGDAKSQFGLGQMYAKGEGVSQDSVQAHMWFNLAAAQGLLISQKARDDVAKKMTPAQIAEAQRLAGEWKPKGQ